MAINKDFLVKNGLGVGGNTSITGSLTAAGLSYPVSDGDPFTAIVTDGNGNLSFNNVDTVESDVTNQTGSLIPKGTPVYQTGAAGNTLTIAPSDASNSATMPAIGVAGSDIADGDTGRVIHFGYIKGVDTSAFTEGDRIYVADGGGYQVGRPTGESNVVQFLGVVTKVHATNGSGVVFGGGRAMDVPNLDDGNIFIGNSLNTAETATLDTSIVPENSNLYFTDARAKSAIEAATHLTIDGGTLYIDTDNNYIGINDTSPQQALDVTGAIAIGGTTVIDSGSEIVTAQLKDSGVTANTYGSASLVPIITVDSKGRITSASTTSVAGVSNFTFNNTTDVLTISTADGGSFPVDISDITVGGSMNGPLADLTVVYQSAAPSDPSQGQMWFDSLNQLMMVYTGSAWVQAVPGGGTTGGGDTTDAVATLEKYTYSIPSTTNSVQGTDDNGNQLAYVVDGSQNVEVFVNGVKQAEGATKDYVATTGTAVTFTYNLPAGTIVDVQVFELLTQDAFYLKADTYTKVETNSQISTALGDYLPLAGGTLTGNLSGTNATFTGDLTVDTNTLFVDSTNNRVGIGTTSPLALVHAYNNTNNSATLPSLGNGDYGSQFKSENANTNAGSFASIDLRSATYDMRIAAITAGGTNTGRTGFLGEVSGSVEEIMTIDDTGYIGIGSIEPEYQLTVHQKDDNTTAIKIQHPSSPTDAGMHLGLISDGISDNLMASVGVEYSGTVYNTLNISRSTRNVGIGTLTPSTALEVNGTVTATAFTGTASNAALLDNLDSTQFLRSDADDTLSGRLGINSTVGNTTNPGSYDSNLTVKDTTPGALIDTGGAIVLTGDYQNNGNYLGQAPYIKAYKQNVTVGDYSYGLKLGVRKNGEGTSKIHTTLDPDGNMLIGTSDTRPDNSLTETGIVFTQGGKTFLSTSSDFGVWNSQTTGTKFYFRVNGSGVGSIDYTTGGVIYNTTSDRRLKENIVTIADGKEKLLAMNPVTFNFIADEEKETVSGFIAQEMKEIVPEAVSGEPDDERMMAMDYGRITPTIVAALQAALKEIEELKERINKLEAK